jgi:serralysin
VRGLGGNDTLHKWAAGDLTYFGGAGIDTLKFSTFTGITFPNLPATGATVDLAKGTGINPYGGQLVLNSVENVSGTFFADTMFGNDAANVFGDGFSDGGADIVRARGGDDTVILAPSVASGARYDGGSGTDTLLFTLESQSTFADAVLDVTDASANAGVFAGITVERFEVFEVSTAFVTLHSFTFRGSVANETVTGSVLVPGTTTVNGKDNLSGRGGDDRLDGRSGNDVLNGGAGDDILIGGAGIDRLNGGTGRDILTGGPGGDLFIVGRTSDSGATRASADVLLDFSYVNDRLDVSDIDAMAGTNGNQSFSFIGSGPFTAEGQVRAYRLLGDTILEFNTSGAAGAEMMIILRDAALPVDGSFLLT